ncbi:hypothetical protein Tco_0983332 [Tanacetum coccineum]
MSNKVTKNMAAYYGPGRTVFGAAPDVVGQPPSVVVSVDDPPEIRSEIDWRSDASSDATTVSTRQPKKPFEGALAKTKKDETKEVKEPPKEWTVEEEIALCQDHPGWTEVKMPHFFKIQGRKRSKTSETTSGSASGGINLNEEADEAVQETQEFRPMGRDRAKAKKKAAGSSSSIVDLVADKFYNMKQKKRKERKGTTGLYGDEESRVEY